MRENETRIGGLQWGMFSIFEPSAPHPHRTIDQSIVAWRLASKAAGSAAFENPRSVIQRTVRMVTGGPNAEHHRRAERARYNVNPGAPTPYNREEFLRYNISPYLFCPQPPDPERTIPVIYRRRTAEEVRRQMVSDREADRRSGYRYPTPEEVAEIQQQFQNPELEHAMELARQEIMRRYWPSTVILNPPGLRESSARNAD